MTDPVTTAATAAPAYDVNAFINSLPEALRANINGTTPVTPVTPTPTPGTVRTISYPFGTGTALSAEQTAIEAAMTGLDATRLASLGTNPVFTSYKDAAGNTVTIKISSYTRTPGTVGVATANLNTETATPSTTLAARYGAGTYAPVSMDINGDGKTDSGYSKTVGGRTSYVMEDSYNLDGGPNATQHSKDLSAAVAAAMDKGALPQEVTLNGKQVIIHGTQSPPIGLMGGSITVYLEYPAATTTTVKAPVKLADDLAVMAKDSKDDIYVALENVAAKHDKYTNAVNVEIEKGDILIELDISDAAKAKAYAGIKDVNGDGHDDYLVELNGKLYYDISGTKTIAAAAAAKAVYGAGTYIPIGLTDIDGDASADKGFIKIAANGAKTYVMAKATVEATPAPDSLEQALQQATTEVPPMLVTYPLTVTYKGKTIRVLKKEEPDPILVGAGPTYYLEYPA